MDSISRIDRFRAWYDDRTVGNLSRSHPFQSAICRDALSQQQNTVTDPALGIFLDHLLLNTESTVSGRDSSIVMHDDSAAVSDLLNGCVNANHAEKCNIAETLRLANLLAILDDNDSTTGSNPTAPVEALSHSGSTSEKRLRCEGPENSICSENSNRHLQNSSSHNRVVGVPTQIPVQQNMVESAAVQSKPVFRGNINVPKDNRSAATEKRTNSNSESQQDSRNAAENSNSLQNRFKTAKQEFVKDGGTLNSIQKRVFSNPSGGSSKGGASSSSSTGSGNGAPADELPEELAQFDRALIERIEADIVGNSHSGAHRITFDDIAGLHFAKKCVQEVICWPMLRPDLFTGLRTLPKGVLLFGPPGTGKTLIGKAIAHQVGATFFSISASSLTSKWIGEGERLVRALFAVAVYRQPSIIFIDEVDSLLCARSSEENEASRRMKTEFLVQLDGTNTDNSAQVIIIGATNRPEELDEAARRRFVKRIYIPLPDAEGRYQLIQTLLRNHDKAAAAAAAGRLNKSAGAADEKALVYDVSDDDNDDCGDGASAAKGTDRTAYMSSNTLSQRDLEAMVAKTEGYSGADIRNLCTEAAMGPVREMAAKFASQQYAGNNIGAQDGLKHLSIDKFPPIQWKHILEAFDAVSTSVSSSDLNRYIEWNTVFGTYKKLTSMQAPAAGESTSNNAMVVGKD